jgi:hypothetical protein
MFNYSEIETLRQPLFHLPSKGVRAVFQLPFDVRFAPSKIKVVSPFKV